MKLSKWILGGMMAVAVAGAVACYAGTFTNHGIVSTSRTLDETAVATEDLNVIDDYSEYPRYLGRHGTIIRTYRFTEMGGTTSTTVKLDTGHKINYIPNHMVIWDGFVEVNEAVLPTGTEIGLGINVTNDIYVPGTGFGTVGKYQIIPVGTVATCVEATNNMPFLANFAVHNPTCGVFTVYMDAFLAQ